jgi:hypothetical protein
MNASISYMVRIVHTFLTLLSVFFFFLNQDWMLLEVLFQYLVSFFKVWTLLASRVEYWLVEGNSFFVCFLVVWILFNILTSWFTSIFLFTFITWICLQFVYAVCVWVRGWGVVGEWLWCLIVYLLVLFLSLLSPAFEPFRWKQSDNRSALIHALLLCHAQWDAVESVSSTELVAGLPYKIIFQCICC